ncbi:alpha/beta fold hydrolase [Saccharothrix australiensis]|uniref:Alpha/beta hydrolase family protein n=1 Tax=Saccharothrix australiensis TaxID=2072 RepID=A0A495W8W7_9PSEU|nr:alpha/beta fold hydrolase [Saccharothrix australiensis]RKT57560.1 alpha/beta hydrolase family protein [Saccharothrix australiensis]
MTRLTTAATALAAAAGLLGGAGAAAAAPVDAEGARGGLSRYYHQRLDWTACDHEELDAAGARCANVTVPVDYAKPGGRTMTVVISRLESTDRQQRRGIMLSNPGGPAAPGLAMPLDIRQKLSPEVRARFDLIGMDPRGVGRSSPLDCGWKVGPALRSAGFDRAGFDRVVAFQQDLARQCVEREGDRLKHVNTRATAHDLDVVRGALGERKAGYMSWSYGTYLGAVYTQMFPHRVDRVVLDSAVNPRRYGYPMFQDMGPASEAAVDEWAAWTARRDAQYHLGTTAAQVRATVEGLVKRAAEQPIRVGDKLVDEHLVPMVPFAGMMGPERWDATATNIRTLVDLADGKPVTPGPALLGLLGALDGPNPDPDGDSVSGVLCGDTRAPRDIEHYWREIERNRASQPLFGALVNSITPCAFWPDPKEEPTVVANRTPALIVQATGDARTTYQHGLDLHKAMKGSRMVTLEDVPVHAVFGSSYSNACTDAAVNKYFETGRLPKSDITCREDEK